MSRFSKTVTELSMMEREIRDMKSRVKENTKKFKEKASEFKSELERLQKQFDLPDDFIERDPLESSEPEVVELSRINNGISCDCSQKRPYDHAFTQDNEPPHGKRKLIPGCHEEVNCKKSEFMSRPIVITID